MTTTIPHFGKETQRATGQAVPAQDHKYAGLPVLGSLLVLGLGLMLVLLQMIPPAVVARSAPPAVFSAERALDHLQVIARAPHPTGSDESLLVRDYLVAQLSQLGLEVQVQTSTSVYHDTGKWGIPDPRGMEVGPNTWALAGATVHNVMARIPGSGSSAAVALVAHYDSVPHGPGASDDGAGVAAILEAARAIQAEPQLRNDIILLLTDGEEIGLMGAQAFVNQHAWMDDIALVLNLEARGSAGTVLMYETNPDNAWIIQEYARAAVAPLTSSVATDVWRMMPNSSDLTLFLQHGKPGLNFAYGENWPAYHTTQDSLDDLDPRSLQHHGANVLALARHFGSLDLTRQTAGDAVFFSVLRLGIVQYPKTWAMPLMAIAALATVVLLAAGVQTRRLTIAGIGLGLAAFLLAAISAGLLAFLTVSALEWLKGETLAVGMGGTYHLHNYELGLLALYLPVTGWLYRVFQHRASKTELAFGGLFFWLVFTIASTLLLPGASYMFLWPLLAGLLVVALEFWWVKSTELARHALRLLPVIVGLPLVGTVIYLVQLMFGVGILPAGGFLTVLLLALVFPYLDFHRLPRPAAWAIAPAAAGLVIIAATFALARTQPDQPALNFTFYSMDADTGQAGWVAQSHLLDETLFPLFGIYPRQSHLSEYFPTTDEDLVWIQDAPALAAAPPALEIVEDSTLGSERTLRLKLISPRGADGIMAEVSADQAILTAALYGERHQRETPRSQVFFKVIGPSPDGVEIILTLQAGVPVTIRLADVSRGLPLDDAQQAALNAGLRSGYGGGHGIDSMTLIHRTITLP